MKAALTTAALFAASALAGPSINARNNVTPITVKGNAFFQGDNRFYIRGVDYQPGGSSNLKDPLADVENCKRDISKFKKLGLNTIRVYSVDNSKNHDVCMNELAAAGIYLILDVNTPHYSISRKNPAESYNAVYLQFIFATVDMFAQYPNTLAFFSGNEVINDPPSSKTAPWVKATTRDLRNYLRKQNLRHVPVGYSAADISDNRVEMAHYMNCGSDDERSDLFAFNDYSWCDPSSFQKSGWDQKVETFSNYGLPLFLSEYGCNKNTRKFQEVHALYSEKMTPVYSGGLVYEWSQADNNFGLVKIEGNHDKLLPDYHALMKAYQETPNPKGDGGYNKTGGASTCPEKQLPAWNVDASAPLPKLPKGAEKYMQHGAGKGPGLGGPGSQNAGNSTGTVTPGAGFTAHVTGGTSSTSSSSSGATSSGAAAGVQVPRLTMGPMLVGATTVLSTLFGAALVLV